jgi:hypothetical protein
MQRAVDLDELHRAAVVREHREGGVAHGPASQRVCVPRDRRDRRRPVHPRAPVVADDVLRLDAGPHDDAVVRELRADLGELLGELPLREVELVGSCEQRVDGCEVLGALLRSARRAPIAHRESGGNDHGDFLLGRGTGAGEASGRTVRDGCDGLRGSGVPIPRLPRRTGTDAPRRPGGLRPPCWRRAPEVLAACAHRAGGVRPDG